MVRQSQAVDQGTCNSGGKSRDQIKVYIQHFRKLNNVRNLNLCVFVNCMFNCDLYQFRFFSLSSQLPFITKRRQPGPRLSTISVISMDNYFNCNHDHTNSFPTLPGTSSPLQLNQPSNSRPLKYSEMLKKLLLRIEVVLLEMSNLPCNLPQTPSP